MPAKPRRAVLRKAADAGIHPAEPRVAAAPATPARAVRSRTGSAGTAAVVPLRTDRSEHRRG